MTKYALVTDDGNTEQRQEFDDVRSAKDAWGVTMLRRKSLFSAMLLRYEDENDFDPTIDENWERA